LIWGRATACGSQNEVNWGGPSMFFHDPNAVRIASAEVRGPWAICC
jgi:hypothetical protein